MRFRFPRRLSGSKIEIHTYDYHLNVAHTRAEHITVFITRQKVIYLRFKDTHTNVTSLLCDGHMLFAFITYLNWINWPVTMTCSACRLYLQMSSRYFQVVKF